jgi:hypothetical protein
MGCVYLAWYLGSTLQMSHMRWYLGWQVHLTPQPQKVGVSTYPRSPQPIWGLISRLRPWNDPSESSEPEIRAIWDPFIPSERPILLTMLPKTYADALPIHGETHGGWSCGCI